MCPGVGLQGWLRWCWVQGTCAAPCFRFPLFKSSSWVFWSPYLLSRTGPSCACMQLFSVRTVSLYFVPLEEVCPGAGVAALQHRAPGPRRLMSLTSTVRSVGNKGTPRSPQGLPGYRMPRAGSGTAGAEDGSVCGPGFPSFVSSESPPSTYCSGCHCH